MDGDAGMDGEENHPAFVVLAELSDSKQISAEARSSLVFKFNKLHQAFAQSCSTEQVLLRRTRDLNKELKSQKTTIQSSASQQQEHRTALTALRQFVTNIQSELEATNEQIETTKNNTAVKKKEHTRLQDKVGKAREDLTAKPRPQKKRIGRENKALNDA